MDLQSDDFELFGVPRRFAQDDSALAARWRELQRQLHPDRFAAEDPAAQRVAMQWSARVNEAWQNLRDPLRRAARLCELHGAAVESESNTRMPPEFLTQQMQWREALDEAGSPQDIAALRQQALDEQQKTMQRCAHLLDGAGDWAAAAQQVRQWMFIRRFASKIEQRQQQLHQAHAPTE